MSTEQSCMRRSAPVIDRLLPPRASARRLTVEPNAAASTTESIFSSRADRPRTDSELPRDRQSSTELLRPLQNAAMPVTDLPMDSAEPGEKIKY